MSRQLFPLTLAALSVNFYLDERVVKPSKKLVDEAKKLGLAKDHADYPKDKQVKYLTPDLSNADNVAAFFTGVFNAAEAAKPGSGEEILHDLVKHRAADASEKSLSFTAEGDPDLDETAYIKDLTQNTSGKATLSQLKALWRELSVECVTLQELAMKIADFSPADQEKELAAVNMKDYQQLLLVLSERCRSWRETGAIIEVRDAEAAKRSEAKKKKEETKA